MKYSALLFISFFCLNLSAQTDTIEWLLKQTKAPSFDWHQIAGKKSKKGLLKFIKHLDPISYASSNDEYNPEECGPWETYILKYFEYCDVDQDGHEDIVNTGSQLGYTWTQIAFGLGRNKYSDWLQIPGKIQYFNRSVIETVIVTYGTACCGYAPPDVIALVSFPKGQPGIRFKYRTFLAGYDFLKDSFSMNYKRVFKTKRPIKVYSDLLDGTHIQEVENCGRGCYDKGAKGIAYHQRVSQGKLWYLVLMPPGTSLLSEQTIFSGIPYYWKDCYYAAGWVEAEALDFD